MSVLYIIPKTGRMLAERLMATSSLPGVYVEPAELPKTSLAEVEALVISTPCYTAELAARLKEEAPKLRWIQSMSTGVDYYAEKGIPAGVTLTSASGAHAPNVADHALSLVLSLYRGSASFAVAQSKTHWIPWSELAEQRSLTGTRAVVLGNGPSGVATAKRLIGFDAKVTLVGRREKEPVPGAAFRSIADLDEILPATDLLVMVLPSNPETVGLMSAERLALLPKGAMLVNVGRGDALDETALNHLLRSGHLGGAGLDVTSVEPLPAESPLWTAPGLVLTPHVAGRSGASYDFLHVLIGENLRRYAADEALLNVVDLE